MWSTGQALPLTAQDSFYNAHQTSRWLTTHILWRSSQTRWEKHRDVLENPKLLWREYLYRGQNVLKPMTKPNAKRHVSLHQIHPYNEQCQT